MNSKQTISKQMISKNQTKNQKRILWQMNSKQMISKNPKKSQKESRGGGFE